MNNIVFFKRYLYEDIKLFILNDKLIFLSNLGKIFINLRSSVFVKNITLFEIVFLFINKNVFNIFLKMFSNKYVYFNKFFFFNYV